MGCPFSVAVAFTTGQGPVSIGRLVRGDGAAIGARFLDSEKEHVPEMVAMSVEFAAIRSQSDLGLRRSGACPAHASTAKMSVAQIRGRRLEPPSRGRVSDS